MGIAGLWADVYAAAFSVPEVQAESPPADDEGKEDEEGKEEEGEEGEEGEEEGEEEEEEEPEDLKPKIEEECAESKGCAPYKHHFDECVERVTEHSQSEEAHKGPKEDCVEEFFHLAHCAGQCAAPKLFAALK
ncbi:MAG: ubiquinol--cytochrome-c reductase subunit 6 [Thelocarpon superellum]|nr:MAG: ubiquinol--cytochrome-c reductase subunit 6 [Thelocarpon superellum]